MFCKAMFTTCFFKYTSYGVHLCPYMRMHVICLSTNEPINVHDESSMRSKCTQRINATADNIVVALRNQRGTATCDRQAPHFLSWHLTLSCLFKITVWTVFVKCINMHQWLGEFDDVITIICPKTHQISLCLVHQVHHVQISISATM